LDFASLAQYVLSGATFGCVYALVALGFVLCANVSGTVNFAQGEYVMIGGVFAAALVVWGVPTWPAVAAAFALGAALGAVQERLTLAPVRRAPLFIQITITLGVAVVIRGIALIAFGKDPIGLPGFAGDDSFPLLGALLPLQTLWVWGLAAALLGGTFWFLKSTDLGRGVRATASNLEAARLMGVRTERLTLYVFAAAAATGALAGAFIAPIVVPNYAAGLDFGLKGFIGAIIGGFRSPGWAVIGGLGIGIVEALAAGYVSSGAKDVVAYGLLIAYLLVRGGVFVAGRRGLHAGAR
jgi:branched-chain amino acid transport system permease protein